MVTQREDPQKTTQSVRRRMWPGLRWRPLCFVIHSAFSTTAKNKVLLYTIDHKIKGKRMVSSMFSIFSSHVPFECMLVFILPYIIHVHYTLYTYTIRLHYTLTLYAYSIRVHYTLTLYTYSIRLHYTLTLYIFTV